MSAKDINLLPEEFRDKDRKEKETIRKKSKVIHIDMTNPPGEKKAEVPAQVKPSLLSRLFSSKSGPSKSLPPRPEKEKESKLSDEQRDQTDKEMHIPVSKDKTEDVRIDLLSGGFLFGKKDDKPQDIPDKQPEESLAPEASENRGEDKVKVDIGHKPKRQRHKKKGGFLGMGMRKKNAKQSDGDDDKSEKGHKDKKRGSGRDHDREIDVNLIPEEMSKHPELEVGRKTFVIGLTAFIALLIAATGFLGITWYQLQVAREINQLEDQIRTFNVQIKDFEQQRLDGISLQKRLKVVRELLDNHLYWTNFFALLEKHTINDVSFTGFAMSGTTDLTLSAIGKDYRSVARQLVAFQEAEDFVENVDIDGASANIDGESGETTSVSFTASIKLKPSVFKQPIVQ